MWDPSSRTVRCTTCASRGSTPSPGVAGRSAERGYRRRADRFEASQADAAARDLAWRREVLQRHPLLGRLTAVIPGPSPDLEPAHVRAWRTGADGERQVGARLDQWAASTGNRVLHDRRIPPGRSNLDHLVVTASHVWVIDTKHHRGAVTSSGPFDAGEVVVAGRRRRDLVVSMRRQMATVADALDRAAGGRRRRPGVCGVLCFVGADWQLLATRFTVGGVTVAWPESTVKLLDRDGRGDGTGAATAVGWAVAALAAAFPPA